MKYKQIIFSGHAIQRMFERAISKTDVLEVFDAGEIIASYPDDKPFPSFLMLGFVKGRPLHVVSAVEKERETYYVITAYDPDIGIWDQSFKKRR